MQDEELAQGPLQLMSDGNQKPESPFSAIEQYSLRTPGGKEDGVQKRAACVLELGGESVNAVNALLVSNNVLKFQESEKQPLIWRLAPTLRPWCPPAEHEQLHTTPTSDKTAVAMVDQDKNETPH